MGYQLQHLAISTRCNRPPGVLLAILVSQALLMGGCGGAANKFDASVTGNVLIEGQLVDGGTITFHPVGDGAPVVGQIRPDGSFSLRVGQGDRREADAGTVPSGEYIVTVVVTGEPVPNPDLPQGPPKGGPRLMAERYAHIKTSDLRRTVESGPNLFVFDLERAEPVEEDSESKDESKNDEVPDEEAAKAKAAEESDAATDAAASANGSEEANAAEAATPPAAGEGKAP